MRRSGQGMYRWTHMQRSTRQREAIQAAIQDAGRPLSAHEILQAAQREVPEIGIATVYRNLKLLQADGQVQTVALPEQPPHYEISTHGHHHHFQCTICQRVFDVHACPGNLDKLAPRGFSVQRHELTLYGLCKDCRKSGAGA